VHGRGVFALADIAPAERIIEYRGEIISWEDAQVRYENSDAEEGHTFFFDRGDGTVIDGNVGGNSARWINHGCDPNCETIDDDGAIVVQALRAIAPGDELFIDYQLIIDGRPTKALREQYACACGAPTCRGTMLAI
jgi:uncharacterized protein